MARRAISMITSPRVQCIFILYIQGFWAFAHLPPMLYFVSLMSVCILYIVKEVALFCGARLINGCGTERALKLYRPAGRKLHACSLHRNWNY